MSTQRNATPPQSLRGFTLVEALVALLILSVGMLGIAGLFVESVRSSRTALLRTQAVNLVADMADRIRANTSAREAYDSASYAADPAPQDCAPSNVSAGANCTLQELAEDDLARWIAAVREPGEAQPYTYRSEVIIMRRDPA
jgi:type IV pilus assembly protein PilV